jgi:hypothetical protein
MNFMLLAGRRYAFRMGGCRCFWMLFIFHLFRQDVVVFGDLCVSDAGVCG